MSAGAAPSTGRIETGVASSAIAPVLRAAVRPVRVLAAFRAAVYLAADDEVVALVAADGIRHPNAIVVTRPAATHPFAGLRAPQRGTIGDGRVTLPGFGVTIARWFDPVPRLAATDAATLAALVEATTEHLETVTGPVPHELRRPATEVASALRATDEMAAVRAARPLIGRGPGLTPAGDDVLAGLLASTLACDRARHGTQATRLATVTRDAGASIAGLARDATTSMSAALLAHAARGAVSGPVGDLLHALTGRGVPNQALERLLTVGHTSGRDLAVGVLAGARLACGVSPESASHTRASRTPHEPRIS